jgi:hypothetical protein
MFKNLVINFNPLRERGREGGTEREREKRERMS